jgi:nucleotide-binding universal stress UspA family protein
MEHHSEVVSELIVCEGHAATELVDKSKGVDMLVVGSRGLGGFRGLLLGSVSQQCAPHAHCPVVIVPAEERS